MALTEARQRTGESLADRCRGPGGVVRPEPEAARPGSRPVRWARCALAVSCALAAVGMSGAGADLSLTTLAQGSRSRVTETMEVVVRAPAEWATLWTRHAGPGVAAPPVDFARDMVVAVFLGRRPTSGVGVQITAVHETGAGRDLEVTYQEFDAAAGTMRRPVITTPFHIVSLPRSEMAVRFRQTAT